MYHGAPREGFRGIFHVLDVPDDLFEYDEHECHTLIPRMSGLDGMTPGLARPFADRITQPVFLAFGETDVSADPHREPAAYPKSPDITLVVTPNMAHMHNFAETRTRLWDRFRAWLEGLAAAAPPASAQGAGLLDLTAASQALAGIRDMLVADGYDISLRALGTDTLAVDILAGPDACAECLVPENIMSGILRDALGSSAVVPRIQLSYPAASSG